MDNLINLQLQAFAPQCLECGGQILHPTPPPFRIDLASGAIHNTRRDGNFGRILSGDLCETCRLRRSEGSDAHRAISQELEDIHGVRKRLDLGQGAPALQLFAWEMTPVLNGATLTSYGVWCLSREALPPSLNMRSLRYDLENGLYLCIIFALEIISLPDCPTELHSRWDPDSGEEWQEFRHMQSGNIGQRKQLLEAMELTWEVRAKGGRPAGSRTFTLEDLEAAYLEAEMYGSNPQQATVASYLGEKGKTAKAVRNRLKEHDLDWKTFENLMQRGK